MSDKKEVYNSNNDHDGFPAELKTQILIQQRPAKAGLGAEGSAPTKLLDPKEEKKQELWRKTQQRFKKLK
ncbi:unnamed protein product [Bemisia tabaci]|uniref:Uncharacterized protein n=1 Tax=Bemisia tabaci TaxID=7038 RepID=A0A9P0AJC3_BEMTA|nr:unnamed protein product [Bemisia tabaci]